MRRWATSAVLLVALCCGCAARPSPAHRADLPDQHTKEGDRPGAGQTVLASGTTDGGTWRFVSYPDPYGNRCVVVDYARQQGIPACDIAVDAKRPANAAMQELSEHLAVAYGRVGDDVLKLYTKSADRLAEQDLHVDPGSRNRYFAVFIRDRSVTDILTVDRRGRTYSLESTLRDFFS